MTLPALCCLVRVNQFTIAIVHSLSGLISPSQYREFFLSPTLPSAPQVNPQLHYSDPVDSVKLASNLIFIPLALFLLLRNLPKLH